MSNVQSPIRWEHIPAYVLHTHPYKETSLIVEVFGDAVGRIALVAKGAKRANSSLRGLLQPFLPLTISFSGKGEVKTLTKAEWKPGTPMLNASALMAGYYINELVLKLVPRDDAHIELFEHYAQAVHALATQGDTAQTLRQFELALLATLGYGIDLTHCADQDVEVQSHRAYAWVPERGIVHQVKETDTPINGAVLLALSSQTPLVGAAAGEAKRFMRAILDYHLERRALVSRRMMQDVQLLLDSA